MAIFEWRNGSVPKEMLITQVYGLIFSDDGRAKHFKNADPQFQPALCRDVPDVWALDPQDASQWEGEIVHDFTPMVIADLI